jgi:predicted SprT family Zn-dependent metalloprotease
MKIEDFEKLYNELLVKYNLTDYRLEYYNRKRSLGSCNNFRKLFKFSKCFIEHSEEEIIKQVILHEFAHALVGMNNGHNQIWKLKCIALGCRPKAINKIAKMPNGRFIFKCPKCKKEFYYHRISKLLKEGRTSCGICSNGRFNREYILQRKLEGETNGEM